MTTIDVNSLLSQMRQMSSQARSPDVAFSSTGSVGATGDGVAATGKSDFGALLKQSIAAVGQNQEQAGSMAAAFERGDPGADLGRTMIAIQKADLSLNTASTVRNKLVDAYNNIMNMSV
jgi:flagellar hook-basal body complex protein FliE